MTYYCPIDYTELKKIDKSLGFQGHYPEEWVYDCDSCGFEIPEENVDKPEEIQKAVDKYILRREKAVEDVKSLLHRLPLDDEVKKQFDSLDNDALDKRLEELRNCEYTDEVRYIFNLHRLRRTSKLIENYRNSLSSKN